MRLFQFIMQLVITVFYYVTAVNSFETATTSLDLNGVTWLIAGGGFGYLSLFALLIDCHYSVKMCLAFDSCNLDSLLRNRAKSNNSYVTFG